MKKQTANILIAVLAVAAIAAYLMRDKIEALFAQPTPPPPPTGTTSGSGTGTQPPPTDPVVTVPVFAPGQQVKSKVAEAYVRNASNSTVGGPFSNGQYIGAFVANPQGLQYQIIYRGQTAFVFKNEVTVG